MINFWSQFILLTALITSFSFIVSGILTLFFSNGEIVIILLPINITIIYIDNYYVKFYIDKEGLILKKYFIRFEFFYKQEIFLSDQ